VPFRPQSIRLTYLSDGIFGLEESRILEKVVVFFESTLPSDLLATRENQSPPPLSWSLPHILLGEILSPADTSTIEVERSPGQTPSTENRVLLRVTCGVVSK